MENLWSGEAFLKGMEGLFFLMAPCDWFVLVGRSSEKVGQGGCVFCMHGDKADKCVRKSEEGT